MLSAPELVSLRVYMGERLVRINHTSVPLDSPPGTTVIGYEVKYLEGTESELTYAAIVSAIVTARCPRDRMEAIVNNYLLDPTSEDAASEMAEMQRIRLEAKEIARRAIDLLK